MESLGRRIGVIYRNTAAYTTYIVQNHFQDKPNSLGFKGQCIIVPVLEMVEFNTKKIEFKDLNQFYTIAPLQDPIRRDPNSQLAINNLIWPYKYTLSNNSIITSIFATIIRLLRQPVLIIYKLVDLYNYTTLSKFIQLPTPNTLYNEKQVLLGRDLQTLLIINSLSILGIFLNLKRPTLELKKSKKSQNIVLQLATPLLLDIPSCLNIQLEII